MTQTLQTWTVWLSNVIFKERVLWGNTVFLLYWFSAQNPENLISSHPDGQSSVNCTQGFLAVIFQKVVQCVFTQCYKNVPFKFSKESLVVLRELKSLPLFSACVKDRGSRFHSLLCTARHETIEERENVYCHMNSYWPHTRGLLYIEEKFSFTENWCDHSEIFRHLKIRQI